MITKDKTNVMCMVAMSIRDYAREMANVDGGSLDQMFNRLLKRHLNKLVAHMLEAATIVDSLELLEEPGSWPATSAKSDD